MHTSMRIRRIIGLFSVLAMMFTIMPTPFTKAADENIGVERVSNGGFENLTDGIPFGWNTVKSAENSSSQTGNYVEKSIVHSGNSAVKMVGGNSHHYIVQKISKPVLGATYEISVWVYPNKDMKGQFGIYYEYYGQVPSYAKSGWIGSGRNTFTDLKPGEWQQVTFTYTHNVDCTTLNFYPSVWGGGTYYVDDLSMIMTKMPPYMTFTTNELLYYTDLDKGWATAQLYPVYYSDFAGWTIEFMLMDGDTILQSSEKLKLNKVKAEWVFNPMLMTDRDKSYNVKAILRDESGNLLQEENTRVERRYDRPKNMTRDGKFINSNGEIFLPVDGYEIYPHKYGEKIYEDAKRMGVTVIESLYGVLGYEDMSVVLDTLDMLQERGFMAMVDLYAGPTIASSPEIIDKIKLLVETVKDHPAVFAYNLGDEPVAKNFTDEQLELAYKTVRDIDSIHPTYICDQQEGYVKKFSKYCDIIGADSYNYSNSAYNTQRYSAFWNNVKENFTRSGKGTLNVLQTFRRSTQAPNNKYPTPDEIRSIFYQCLFEGVSGFGYYTFAKDSFSFDGNLAFYETAMGDAIEEWMKNEKKDAVDYFLKGVYPTFDKGETSDIRYDSYVKNGYLYYIVLNKKTDKEVTFDIDVVSDNSKVSVNAFRGSVVAGTDKEMKIEGREGVFSAKLAPAEAAVFELRPVKNIDVNLLIREEKEPLTDISGYNWAQEAIEQLYEEGIVNISGEGKFKPGENITRGDFAMFLVRTLDLKTENAENFDDVPQNAEYTAEIAAGKAHGILLGSGDNRFNPDAYITRQDVMTMLARALRLSGDFTKLNFTDNDRISDYAKECVAGTVAAGIISGNPDGSLKPLSNTTRAEAAVIMHRIYNKYR